ncbi:hypothetical protein [Methylorubrum populi]|uniref:hypothetical protein n=1 Tax=Methylorubrum populi TaxID=223967 RepID=UPI00235631F3|nr:hypothetical protein [Methylorubrum populi]
MAVNNMEQLIKFVETHPISTSFATVGPMIIPAQYHLVFAQLLLQLGIFGIEFLYRKLKIRKRNADIEQSFDDYLKDKEPTEKR